MKTKEQERIEELERVCAEMLSVLVEVKENTYKHWEARKSSYNSGFICNDAKLESAIANAVGLMKGAK